MTLVSIIGDFHSSILPLSYAFRKEMKRHIIVYDDSHIDTQESRRVLRGQKAFLEEIAKSGEDYVLIPMQIDEDSYESIIACCERILSYIENPDKIYLNATDGLSSIAIVLSYRLMKAGARVIAYDRYANTYNLHTSESMERKIIPENMDIKSHLLLKGYKIISYTSEKELMQRKGIVYALAEDLSRYKKFAGLLQHNRVENIQGFEDFKMLLQKIGKLHDKAFIQGTLFEEYIYHLLRDHFSFDDICTGVKVEFAQNVENEFDILMIKDNHLHTIECKLVSALNGEHFVYKTELIMDYLDDDGKAMILSIGGENVRITANGRKKVQFSAGDLARAKYGNIKIHQKKVFDKTAFLEDVSKWFCM
jgi:hypothetical protein